MAKILNIETATTLCSVALAIDGQVVAQREIIEEKAHAASLSVFINELLQETNIKASELQAVAIGKGPGSYTGLRIGVSTAKGLCYGLNIPLIAVGTLRIMAYYVVQMQPAGLQKMMTSPETLLCPMIDARRMEVYTGCYDIYGNEVEKVAAKIITKSSYRELLEKHHLIFFGSGMNKCKEVLNHKNASFIDSIYPHASALADLSENKLLNNEIEDLAYFEPFYLKDFIATTSKKGLKV